MTYRCFPSFASTLGEKLLRELLQSGNTTRVAALELLAVDALVTYAFQAAASQPSTLEERAAQAMKRISAATSGAAHSASVPNAQPPRSD